MLFSLMNKKGIRLYAERTEHPYVATTRALNNRKYLKACTKIDGLFVISTALKEFFIKNGARAEKVHIINMTVDTTRFKGLTKHESNSRYIAYCGSASNNKDGVNDLIKAFAIVHKKFPTIKLYIIGRPLEKKDESGNRRLVEQLGITDDVVFTGVVKAEQMPQLLKDAVLLALARPDSLQAQCGFPTKLGEYLLTENPVVVSKVGDIPLFLEDGKTALLSEQNNIEEFASKMEWVLEHPKESEVIGRNGAEVALNEFNCVKEAKKIIDIIK
jgi:glycosyltransferase involved in cell wall biosynthesis